MALQDERDALAAAHAGREDAGAGGGRDQLPLLVEGRALAAWALAEPRIDLEDRDRGGKDERQRSRSAGLAAEIENPAIGAARAGVCMLQRDSRHHNRTAGGGHGPAQPWYALHHKCGNWLPSIAR